MVCICQILYSISRMLCIPNIPAQARGQANLATGNTIRREAGTSPTAQAVDTTMLEQSCTIFHLWLHIPMRENIFVNSSIYWPSGMGTLTKKSRGSKFITTENLLLLQDTHSWHNGTRLSFRKVEQDNRPGPGWPVPAGQPMQPGRQVMLGHPTEGQLRPG